MNPTADNHHSPSPEMLAAYADGELGATERACVAGWLSAHPEAAADVEAQQRIRRLFQDAQPPEPGEATWRHALHQLEARLAERKHTVVVLNGVEHPEATTHPADLRRRRAWAIGIGAAVTAIAAAIVLAFFLRPGTTLPLPLPGPRAPVDDEVFLVASDLDVHISSMDDDDAGLLIVGEAPLPGPIVLATPDDIQIHKVEQDPTDGMLPKQLNSWPNMPMIIAPLQPGPEEQ